MLLASALVAAGLAVSGVSLMQIAARNPQMAQATPPLQSSPPPADQDKPPAESKPGGERPTTPALPPAPAEKTAPPIPEKK